MRLKNILCFAAFSLFLNVQAQDLKILVDKKGKIGYADMNGNEVIRCQYDSGQPFKNGTAIVTKAEKNGIIDVTGKVLLPLKFTQITPWTDELYMVKDGKKIGLADHSGKLVLPPIYSHISKLNCYGKAFIALGGKSTSNDKKTYMANAKYGIIDAKGHILIDAKYKGLYEFTYDGTNKYPYYEGKRLEFSYHNTVDTLVTDCSYLGFSENGSNIYGAGIMDDNGKELLKTNLYDFVMQPQSGMVRYYIIKKKETLCGYHELSTGKSFQATQFNSHINDIKFWSHGDFIGDIAPVNGKTWSFINKNGFILRTGFSSLKHGRISNLWAAKNNQNKWEIFDNANINVDVLCGYEDINFPNNEGDKEVFSVKKDEKYGVIDRDGKVIVPFEYEQISANIYDVLLTKKDGKWGMLSVDGTVIIPMEYKDVVSPGERNAQHFWVKKSDSLWYHYNYPEKILSKTGYSIVNNFVDQYAFVLPKGMKDGTYINIINVNDEDMFGQLVPFTHAKEIRRELKKHQSEQLTQNEKKILLLDVTKGSRSYKLNSIISETEWDY